MSVSGRDRFLELLRAAITDGTLVKLTLGKYRGGDGSIRNLFVRPVALKTGPHLAFVWRHATNDITKNLPPAAAITELERLIGRDFLDAHLFSTSQQAQLETKTDGTSRVRVMETSAAAPSLAVSHDTEKQYLIDPSAPWLRALGVTNDKGRPREGMADKFRQIQKFAELLSHLITDAFPASAQGGRTGPVRIADMGSGKGYLTFAVAALLGARASVHGIEARAALVELCNRVAIDHGMSQHLLFSTGTIADTPLDQIDVLIALHACDTATDDALAKGISAGARLLVVAPCCQKELRRQLTSPPVLAGALRHGIFQERQAEFLTDALRAQLLEWAGYRTKVFEFISTEHTAKNIMIAAVRQHDAGTLTDSAADRLRAFARFYGIRSQALARQLGFELAEAKS